MATALMPATVIRTAIIGTGFAGLGMAMRLRDEGDDDFLVFEKAADIGGVWRDNVYPGCSCDVQSHLYGFASVPNPNWSRVYAPQPEILAYLADCVRDRGLAPFLRLNEGLSGARWDDGEQRWHLTTAKGDYVARFLVLGIGGLSDPRYPTIPGQETFAGALFHSARWRHDVDLAGKRVGVIGTGASAIQIIPAIQPVVGELVVFQRSPPWVMRRGDKTIGPLWRSIFARLPVARAAARFILRYAREVMVLPFTTPWAVRLAAWLARRELQGRLKDPVKRALAQPRYAFGCKRVLVSDDYYEALDCPNVRLETESIAAVTPAGIITADGREHQLDAIIMATGFGVITNPLYAQIIGRHGRVFVDALVPSAKAYYGTTTPGFPNLFAMQGPNSGLGHTSVILMIEAQIAHVIEAQRYLDATGVRSVEVSRRACDDLNDEIGARLRTTVWEQGGCSSWYLGADGRNFALWPGTSVSFAKRARRFDPTAYIGRR